MGQFRWAHPAPAGLVNPAGTVILLIQRFADSKPGFPTFHFHFAVAPVSCFADQAFCPAQ